MSTAVYDLRMCGRPSDDNRYTNADKIRDMSVEELAGMIACPHLGKPYRDDICAFTNKNVGYDCLECCIRWLNETASP